jgi:hypothetical protein
MLNARSHNARLARRYAFPLLASAMVLSACDDPASRAPHDTTGSMQHDECPEFAGVARTAGRALPWQLVTQDDEHRLSIRIEGDATTVWVGEVGQTFPRSVSTRQLGPDHAGLVLDAGWGASMLRRVVVLLDTERGFPIVFDQVSRFGSDFVHLDDDRLPELVSVSGTLDGPKRIRVYAFGEDGYTVRREFIAASVPTYDFR